MKMNVAPIITSFLHKLWKMCYTGCDANKEECCGLVHDSQSLSRPPVYTHCLFLSSRTHSSYIMYYCYGSCHSTVLDKTCMRADVERSFSFLSILLALFFLRIYSWLFKPIKNRDTIKYHNNFTNAEMSNHQTPNVINFVYVPKTFLRGY